MTPTATSTAPVSVVLPVRDGERYLAEALDSVLGQVPAPCEVVVVDDGSKDRSVAIAEAADGPVRVIRTPPRGVWPATNRGIADVSAPLLAFIDADDRWTPGRLAEQVAVLDADPQMDAVGGQVASFYSPDLSTEERHRRRATEALLDGFVMGAIVFRRAAFEQVGPFDEEQRLGGLIDWWARAQDVGLRVHHLDRVTLERRIHAANTTTVTPDLPAQYARALKLSLDRRRTREAGP